jgi:Uri superfamily endonuclease
MRRTHSNSSTANPHLPDTLGSYALLLWLERPRLLKIGRLGTAWFPPGMYAYLGSALGPGGLKARLGRHLREKTNSHWHIDHLQQVAQVLGYAYLPAKKSQGRQPPQECRWSQALSALPEANVPLPGFGASDCRAGCPAHLVHLPKRHAQQRLITALQSTSPGKVHFQALTPDLG